MLPNLKQLTLGGGFHLVDADDQSRFLAEQIVDPATQEAPGERLTDPLTHQLSSDIFSFRIESELPKSDGTPRYIDFTASTLWLWVQNPLHNGRLPNGSGQRILREDWWRLHAMFSTVAPTAFILAYVNTLTTEAQFTARQAQARQRILNLLAVARASVLLLSPGRSFMRDESWVRWRFWLQNSGTQHPQFFSFVSSAFKDLWHHMTLTDGSFATATRDSTGHIRDDDMLVKKTDTRNPTGWRNLRQVVFAVRMRSACVDSFLETIKIGINRYGLADFVRRAHGIDHAFGGAEFECLGDLPHLVSPVLENTRSILPPITQAASNTSNLTKMTLVRYNTLSPYVSLTRGANPADQRTTFPPPRSVSLRWRFFLKVDGQSHGQLESKMKRSFFEYMRTTDLRMGPIRHPPLNWSNSLELRLENRNVGVKGDPTLPENKAAFEHGQPAVECVFLLALPEPQALAFLKMCNERADSWCAELFGLPFAFATAADMPRERAHATFGPFLTLTPAEYQNWQVST